VYGWFDTMRYLNLTGKSLAIAALAIGFGCQAAQAVQYKAILQTGQSVAGNDQPLADVGTFAVDTQQNVVATITTKGNAFSGVYRIANNAQPQLLGLPESSFGDISISLGEVGYVARQFDPNSTTPLKYQLKLGKPGAIKTLLTVDTVLYTEEPGRDERPSGVSVVNGKAFFLANQPAQLGQPELRGLVQYQNNQLDLILKPNDPIFLAGGNPPLQLNGVVGFRGSGEPRPPVPVRASSETLVLSRLIDRSFQVFERPNGGSFRKIYEGVTGKMVSASPCGIAASRSNVVVCSVEGPNDNNFYTQSTTKLLLRIGRDSQFKEVKFPKTAPNDTVSSQALSGKVLAFVVQKISPDERNTIYLSNNGASPQRLLGTGDKLNGKVVSRLELASNGQSLGSGFLIFKATFTDNSIALYKAML
jgi:hypothetical protein